MADKLQFCSVGTLLGYQYGFMGFIDWLCLSFGRWAPLQVGSYIFWTWTYHSLTLSLLSGTTVCPRLHLSPCAKMKMIGSILKVRIIELCAVNIFKNNMRLLSKEQNQRPVPPARESTRCSFTFISSWDDQTLVIFPTKWVKMVFNWCLNFPFSNY